MLTVILLLFTQQKLSQAVSCPAQPQNTDVAKYNDINAVFKQTSLDQTYSTSLQGFFDLANSFLNTVQPDSPVKALGLTLDSLKDLDMSTMQDKLIKYETPMI